MKIDRHTIVLTEYEAKTCGYLSRKPTKKQLGYRAVLVRFARQTAVKQGKPCKLVLPTAEVLLIHAGV